MKVIVAGPRNFNDQKVVFDAIDSFKEQGDQCIVTEIVSGCAKGVDTLGILWAKKNGVKVKQFPAQWNNLKVKNCKIKEHKFGQGNYNVLAGLNRNIEMAEYADALIAIDTGSSGTKHMISTARKQGLLLYVVKI